MDNEVPTLPVNLTLREMQAIRFAIIELEKAYDAQQAGPDKEYSAFLSRTLESGRSARDKLQAAVEQSS